ncbi:hypothetical protein C1H46_012302 [Malus baccata]|uniref:Uncharacterized protein n=1 Tax=Malus baccata TaxID=106549 RepID=A0A540MTF5_MALBA|nr:hypothetical protein C1H46_012302 [Malus baccata]
MSGGDLGVSVFPEDYFAYLYPDASVDRIFSIMYLVVGLFYLFLIIFYSYKSEAYIRINVGLSLFVVSLLVVPLMDVFYIKGRNMARSVLQVMGANINSHNFDENLDDGCPEEMSKGRRISITQFKSFCMNRGKQSDAPISAGSK